MKASHKSPGIRGWRWAAGLKPKKGDRYLWTFDGSVTDCNAADLTRTKHPAPKQGLSGTWGGYIRRIPASLPAKKRARKTAKK